MSKKIIIPVVAVFIAIGGIMVLGGKEDVQSTTTTTQRTLTIDELFAFKGDTEDKGIIKTYGTASEISGGGFKITYLSDNGKLNNITIKDLYVMGDVDTFNGSEIVIKQFNNNVLTADQISLLAYSINKDRKDAESMISKLSEGSSIKVGFIKNKEDQVQEEEVQE